MPRKKKMTDVDLRKHVEGMLVSSEWYDNAESQQNFEQALDSYLGRKQGASIPGSPHMRSEDTADMVEAVTAQIMPAFHFDEIAQWEPHGAPDVDQAKLESKICNQYIFDFNDGDLELQSAIKDALLLRNGIVKVYPEEQQTSDSESYTGLDALELQQVQMKTAPLQEINVTKIEPNADDKEQTDINLTRVTTYRRLDVECIDPTNFIIGREHTSVDPAGAAIVGERRFEYRGDLIAMGYPRAKVDALPITETDTRPGSLARNRTRDTPLYNRGDKSLDRIEVFELYMLVDVDQDGIAERRRIIYAGGTSGGVILENEPHPLVPYAAGTPFLYPHRFQGISLFDKLRELEKQKSKALTQYAANIQNANFPELIVEDGAVAEADYTTRRSSGVIRADTVTAVRELPVTDIGTSSIMFLNYLDKVRAERGGAALDMQSAEGQIASESAYGVDRMYTTREQLSTLICNTLADTLVKQIFRLVHKNLKEFFTGPQDFHVGQNQFVSADSSTWPHRMKVRVTAGMSAAERQQRRAVLESHLLQQEKLWTSGQDGVLVDYQTYYSTLVDWSKAGGMHSPRRYWIDPASDAAQQSLQAKAQAAQAQQQKDEQLQKDLIGIQLMVADRDNTADVFKHLTELRFKYWNGVLDSEIEELRTQAQGAESADPDPDQIDEDQQTGRESAETGAVIQ